MGPIKTGKGGVTGITRFRRFYLFPMGREKCTINSFQLASYLPPNKSENHNGNKKKIASNTSQSKSQTVGKSSDLCPSHCVLPKDIGDFKKSH